MTKKHTMLTMAWCLLVMSLISHADTTVSLSGTQLVQLKNADDQLYTIFISKPEGALPYTGGYPVIYILDANAFFASFHEAKRLNEDFKKAIIVGVGYPTDLPHDFYRRAYDFSPPVAAEKNDPPQGGQDKLLSFIENILMPEIDKRFNVDKAQQTLVGHSFSGMFTVYTLFNQPDLFKHYVSVSPSLWWHDRYLLSHEKTFVNNVEQGKHNVTHSSLSLIVAENDSPQEVQDAQLLNARLQKLSQFGLRSYYQVIDDHDHMSVMTGIETDILADVLSARIQ